MYVEQFRPYPLDNDGNRWIVQIRTWASRGGWSSWTAFTSPLSWAAAYEQAANLARTTAGGVR